MQKLLIFFIGITLIFVFPAFKTTAQDETPPPLAGKIAYVGTDGNVYVLDPQNSHTDVLTKDATSEAQYRWPTWSTDGRLAYFLTKATPLNVETDIFISTGGENGKLVYAGSDEAFTYAYWSPKNCDQGKDCRELAVLMSNLAQQDLSVKLIRNGDDVSIDSLAGIGTPFYYSWSPEGDKMLWQRNNTSIDIYDAKANQLIDTLPQQPGYFQAPAWSPVDDRWLFGALGSDQRSTDLVIVGNNETQTLVPQLAGPVAFSWSPDGNSIAYVENGGVLFDVDAHTGVIIARSSVTGVYAFFWSPDSRHIAYITQATSPGSFNAYSENSVKMASIVQNPPALAWSVMDVDNGATHRYGAFIPTGEMIYLLGYFDQFSQSHRIWSPDSRYLIYGEITPDKREVISLLDTSQTDTVPFSIAEGVIGVWSFS